MAVRLSKIAREFNVGLSTIVEFLHSKGIKISSDPNAKLTDEDYALVAKEFSSDSQVKKESSLVDLKNTRKKKETVTIDNAGNISSGNENTEEEEDAGYKPSIFFDFDTGDFVTLHDGKLKEASGFEAWVQWCYKTIMTQRYAHEGYSTDIGIDYESALQADSREEAESILQREIEEALMADPSERTLYVGNIMFQWEAEHCLVTVQVQGIDGDIEIQTQFESGVV